MRVDLSLKGFHIYYNGNTSFTYAVRLAEGESRVKLSFSAGDYVISNLKCFIGSGEILQEDSLYQSEFQPDFVKTKGNRISGKLSVKNDGCLVTSIPYDSGFEIWIDGVCVKPQKINMAFLGAAITKGEHRVEIIYHAAGVTMGKLISCAGLLMWGFLLAMDRRRNGAGSFC